eukprot:6175139-Pleurochrysis_carterae.AAC.2
MHRLCEQSTRVFSCEFANAMRAALSTTPEAVVRPCVRPRPVFSTWRCCVRRRRSTSACRCGRAVRVGACARLSDVCLVLARGPCRVVCASQRASGESEAEAGQGSLWRCMRPGLLARLCAILLLCDHPNLSMLDSG